MTFFFVGERRSQKAINMNVRWQDGALAAKTLFEALRVAGIDPQEQKYDNIFEDFQHAYVHRKDITQFVLKLNKYKVVALGNRVSSALTYYGVKHIKIIHPAARGKIRKREKYIVHVCSKLEATQ